MIDLVEKAVEDTGMSDGQVTTTHMKQAGE